MFKRWHGKRFMEDCCSWEPGLGLLTWKGRRRSTGPWPGNMFFLNIRCCELSYSPLHIWIFQMFSPLCQLVPYTQGAFIILSCKKYERTLLTHKLSSIIHTALFGQAVRRKKIIYQKRLRKWFNSYSPKADRKVVELLLKGKPQSVANWQDYEGRLPLHLAVVHAHKGK